MLPTSVCDRPQYVKRETSDFKVILDELARTIREDLKEDPVAQQDFSFMESKQVESDRRSLEVRLKAIPEEFRKESEEIARRYSLAHRKPSPRSLAFEQWASEAGATTRWRVEWNATLYLDGGAREVKLDTPRGWTYGAPLDAIVGLLNELGRRRWQLVTIGEDKGLYAGIESANSTAPVRLRYTFCRERL